MLKTNFYQPTKVALSFRLAPDFLPEVEYPKKPFGMFFVIGELLEVWSGGFRYLSVMHRWRIPWVPHSLQGRRPWRYPSGHVA